MESQEFTEEPEIKKEEKIQPPQHPTSPAEEEQQQEEQDQQFAIQYEQPFKDNQSPPQEPPPENKPEVVKEEAPADPPKKQAPEPISEYEKEWIIKEAEMQRIGGTYDFFAGQMQKYRRHLQARKTVLQSIYNYINQNKSTKKQTISLLNDYFKDYAEVCQDFHERSYKYSPPKQDPQENKIVNIGAELKEGFNRLINMRKGVGDQHSRMNKLIRSTILPKLEKAMDIYWGNIESGEVKLKDKMSTFKYKEEKIKKRTDKITKVFGKGRYGDQISEDVFIEMTKFVKEERQMRASIFDWGKELQSLRKTIMNADYNLMLNFQAILGQYKSFNDTVFQLKKKKYNFSQHLKEQIQSKYLYENMCSPIDNDYIRGIINYKKKLCLTLLKQTNYEEFLNEEFFQVIMGDLRELLKGTITKVFPLKNPEEDLVRTVSNNFVLYNKKTLEIRNKMAIANTSGEFQGQGIVMLTEKQKGIIFDSENTQVLTFTSNDRAQQLMMYLSLQLQKEQV